MKSIADLNATIWYRFIKVAYILFFLLVWIIVITLSWQSFTSAQIYDTNGASGSHYLGLFLSVVGVPIVFIVITRIFYYILLGSINPPKQ